MVPAHWTELHLRRSELTAPRTQRRQQRRVLGTERGSSKGFVAAFRRVSPEAHPDSSQHCFKLELAQSCSQLDWTCCHKLQLWHLFWMHRNKNEASGLLGCHRLLTDRFPELHVLRMAARCHCSSYRPPGFNIKKNPRRFSRGIDSNVDDNSPTKASML